MDRNIERLFSSARRMIDITKVRGITSRLKWAFYRHAKMWKGTSSKSHGTRIHRQLFHAIECKPGKCNCTIKKGKDTVKVKTRKIHVDVQNALQYLAAQGLTPIAAEVPVLCKTGGLGTALDMVCRWGTDKHAVISVKTGGCKEWRANDFFKPPLDHISVSPKNINQLQSACELELLRQDGIHPAGYFILHINPKEGIRLEKLDAWAQDPKIQKQVLDAVLVARKKTRAPKKPSNKKKNPGVKKTIKKPSAEKKPRKKPSAKKKKVKPSK
jgi:hypothetical protein